MTYWTSTPARAGGRRGWVRAAVAACVLLPLAACDLNVADPQIVREDQLTGEAALRTLLNGAIGDFGIAYAGDPEATNEGIILVGGLRGDEWLNRDTFGTRQEIDRGTIQADNASNQTTFRLLQRARRSAELAADRFAELAPDDARRSEALSLAGYTYVLLGEHYCSGIPFSRLLPSGAYEFGEPLTTAEVFERARQRFTEAESLALDAGDDDHYWLARLGNARAALNLGQFAAAGAAAAGIPVDFVYSIEYSDNTERQNNGVFAFNNIQRRWGVADREGGSGMPFVSANDPRVPTQVSSRNGLDNVGRVLNQLKYPTRSSDIPLATGIEAALIRAEAALQAGNPALAVQIHSELRQSQGLGALTVGPGEDVVDVHFRERAFWLFATAHRLGDMRRLLAAPYNRPFAAVFPTGSYFKGGFYGMEANLPVPKDEQNNPNFTQCLNRDR